MMISHKQNEVHPPPSTPSRDRIMNSTKMVSAPKTPATPKIANSSNNGQRNQKTTKSRDLGTPDVTDRARDPSAAAAASVSLPKCMCNWKNCRAYQKAFREVKHPAFDGVVKIKLVKDHTESMAYKDCLDRTLGISKPPDWKKGTSSSKVAATCKYVIAKHHFTERHMQKYELNPKSFSFVKPFSIHGAKKYLFTMDSQETIPADEAGGGSLYLQCPNVPREVVKQEFHQAMEKLKSTSTKESKAENATATKESNNISRKNADKTKSQDYFREVDEVDEDDDIAVDEDDEDDNKSIGDTSQHVAMLKSKEAENKLLKDQLEAMKSQLTFLHDMVVKLQEHHFESASVVSGRSSRHSIVGGGTKNQRNKATKKISGNTAATWSLSTTNEQSHQQIKNKQQQKYTGTGFGGRKGSGIIPNNNPTRRGSIGVPDEINVDEDDVPDMESQTLASNWHEGEGDWTETQYESDDDESDDDEDDVSYAEKTVATSQTFKTKYKLRPGDELDQNSDDDDDEEDDEEDFDLMSLAATTIVSASKSVKTLPREIELDEDSSDTHESLEEEAFDLRSFASRSSHSVWRNTHNTCDSSYVSMSSQQSSRRSNSIVPGSRNPMNEPSSRSVGPGGKKPNRRRSRDPKDLGVSPNKSDNRSTDSASIASRHGLGATYEVTSMGVTDPYGENGSYTGAVSQSTGMPHGYGRLEYERAGRWYEGDWKHGRWTGNGRLSNGDGDLYEGGLQNDHKHGYGIMRFADGRTFEGEYLNGQMVNGKMTYHDGSTYDGCWEDGMRHGQGRCVFSDESVYEGQFKEGEFFGYGKMTWNDGGWYEGEWLNGEMHGRGREIRADRSLRHDGEWVKGQPLRTNRHQPQTQPQLTLSQQQQHPQPVQQQSQHRRSVAPV